MLPIVSVFRIVCRISNNFGVYHHSLVVRKKGLFFVDQEGMLDMCKKEIRLADFLFTIILMDRNGKFVLGIEVKIGCH